MVGRGMHVDSNNIISLPKPDLGQALARVREGRKEIRRKDFYDI